MGKRDVTHYAESSDPRHSAGWGYPSCGTHNAGDLDAYISFEPTEVTCVRCLKKLRKAADERRAKMLRMPTHATVG